MTVAVKPRRIDYLEDGVTVAFPVTWKFTAPEDIRALRTAADGTQSGLTYGVNYSVSGGGDDNGGTLTLSVAGIAGGTLSIWSETPRGQTADYPTNGTFPAETHEARLDQLAMVDQEQDAELLRTPKFPRGSAPLDFADLSAVADGTLLEVRDGKLRAFDHSPFAGGFYAGGVDGRFVRASGTGSDPALRADLATAAGAALVGHTPAFAAPAIVKSIRSLLNDEPSLGHFFTYVTSTDLAHSTDAIGQANADNWAEVTHALRLLGDYSEVRLKWPAGIVPISKMDFQTLAVDGVTITPASRTVLDVQGAVQLVGTDASKRCVFGSTEYEDNPPVGVDPLFIRGVAVQGGALLITNRAGEAYRHIMQIDSFVEGRFEKIYVSAATDLTASPDGHLKAIKSDISFFNRFVGCVFGTPGLAPIGKNSYNFWQGSNNNNDNRFEQSRLAGAYKAGFNDRPDDRRVGFHLSGENNVLEQCDMSVIDICVESEASRSLEMHNCYGEIVGTVLDASLGLTQAPRIMGGFFEIATGKTAIKATSCQGLSVDGGRWFKVPGATATTFLNMGGGLYGRSVRSIETIAGRELDTWETGTERGHGDLPVRAAEAVKGSRFMFPPTQNPSPDPNTLDDYQENITGTTTAVTPVLKLGTNVQPIDGAQSYMSAVKVGRKVTLNGKILQNGALVGTGNNSIEGCPHLPHKLTAGMLTTANINHTGNLSIWLKTDGTIQVLATTTAGARSILNAANWTATSEVDFAFEFVATQ